MSSPEVVAARTELCQRVPGEIDRPVDVIMKMLASPEYAAPSLPTQEEVRDELLRRVIYHRRWQEGDWDGTKPGLVRFIRTSLIQEGKLRKLVADSFLSAAHKRQHFARRARQIRETFRVRASAIQSFLSEHGHELSVRLPATAPEETKAMLKTILWMAIAWTISGRRPFERGFRLQVMTLLRIDKVTYKELLRALKVVRDACLDSDRGLLAVYAQWIPLPRSRGNGDGNRPQAQKD